MANFLKDTFEKKENESAHDELIKFGRGTFQSKYIIEAKKTKNALSIKTSSEFANFLVRYCLSGVKENLDVKGVITATFDVSSKAEFEISEVKNAMGVKKAIIETQASPEKIIKLMNDFPRAFFALSFKGPKGELKIKPKSPKSGKPSPKGEKEPKAEFCSLKTSDLSIVNELFFDCINFNNVSINHTIHIEDIEIPKGISDPVKVRENSKRKGKIIRNKNVDGVESKSEASFFA